MVPEALFAKGHAAAADDLYSVGKYGNVRFCHITDTHAQLEPVYFREPNINIGVGRAFNQPPHLVGNYMLKHFGVPEHTRRAYAFSFVDFAAAGKKYGKTGGFSHIKTLIDRLRAEVGAENCITMDGGDLWQGSATSLWTKGQDMVEASNLLGVDYMTGHWEFTYPEKQVRENIKKFKGQFLAQNVFLTENAQFNGAEAFDPSTGRVFKPYDIRTVNRPAHRRHRPGVPVYAHRQSGALHSGLVVRHPSGEDAGGRRPVRQKEKADAVVVISHNGMDVDLKLAGQVSGIDVIFGGHTHDCVPKPTIVKNKGGHTIVGNAGSNGKYVAVMDLDVGKGKLNGFRYHYLPVISDLLPADHEMAAFIDKTRQPYQKKLAEKLAVADDVMYRRGNFNGTFDQVICDAMLNVLDAEICFSPGFRWGVSLIPGEPIDMDYVMTQTAITYPETYVKEMTGAQIKATMEDVCDNLFNKDPYVQQGGDMVRMGGMNYSCEPGETMGHRISDMTFYNGKPVDPNKKYKVAGWATVNSKAPGKPIWDVTAEYLRDRKTIHIDKFYQPKLKGVVHNEGVEDYGSI
jgi:sulfate thiol esterase SoxB